MTKKVLIAYHANCNDGQMAAFVAWKHFDRTPHTVAVNYDTHKISFKDLMQRLTDGLVGGEDLKDYELIIVDFSFKPETLLMLAAHFGQVIMLDHHAGAMKDFDEVGWRTTVAFQAPCAEQNWLMYMTPADNLHVYFCMGQSGALMTWHFLKGDHTAPLDYIKYTSDRDLFKFVYPETRNFAAGINLHRFKPWPEFEKLLENVAPIIDQGEVVETMRNVRIDSILSRKPMLLQARVNGEMQSVSIGVYNAPADITSDLLHKYIQTNEEGVKIGMTYTIGTDNVVYCSLRSASDTDCSVIAQMLGGNGHKQACGFTMPLGLFFLVLHTGSLTDHLYREHPVAQWGYRRYGSPPELGYTVVSRITSGDNGTPIAYLGDSPEVGAAIDDLVRAHNDQLNGYFS